MKQLNAQAQAIAIRRAIAKSKKIKLLEQELPCLISQLDQAQRDSLVEKLATAKAVVMADGSEQEDHMRGQEWYVKDLISFAALGGEQRPDESEEAYKKRCASDRMHYEYALAFPEVATEDEGVDAITAYL